MRSARRTVGRLSCNGSVACTIAAAALLSSAAKARADSDGYYCVGGGFLAVEFRSFNTPGLRGPQVLRIARLDTIHGARWTDQVIIEDFQPHVLECGMTTVLLEGAGGPRPGFDSYLIEVDSAGKATITKHRDVLFRPGEVGPSEPRNLGDWATPGITTLPTINWSNVSFQLRITHTTKPISAQLIEHDRLSVVERIVKGQLSDSLIVYESHRKLPPENGGSVSASSRGAAGRIVDGKVRFASYNARDTAHTAQDSTSPAAMRLNGVPAPPDTARLTGSMLRIEPLGVELTLPPAWFGARDSTMRPTATVIGPTAAWHQIASHFIRAS